MAAPGTPAIVEEALARFAATGELAFDLYAPDVTFVTRGEFGGDTFNGHDGMSTALAGSAEAWEKIALAPGRITAHGDAVVADMHFALRARSGVELKVDEAWMFWVREGKINRVEQHTSRAQALAAIGD